MEISYRCGFARYNDDKEEGVKDSVTFIIEFDTEERHVKHMYQKFFSTPFLYPLKSSAALEQMKGLEGEYRAGFQFDPTTVKVISDNSFSIDYRGSSIKGWVDKNTLRCFDLNSLKELKVDDYLYNVIFTTSEGDKDSNRVFYYASVDLIEFHDVNK